MVRPAAAGNGVPMVLSLNTEHTNLHRETCAAAYLIAAVFPNRHSVPEARSLIILRLTWCCLSHLPTFVSIFNVSLCVSLYFFVCLSSRACEMGTHSQQCWSLAPLPPPYANGGYGNFTAFSLPTNTTEEECAPVVCQFSFFFLLLLISYVAASCCSIARLCWQLKELTHEGYND